MKLNLILFGLIVVGIASAAFAEISPKLRAVRFGEVPETETEIESRITNGVTAKPGEYLYQAGLALYKFGILKGFCGGSILNERIILTAAHCTEHALKVDVFVGSNIREQSFKSITVYANSITTHEDYDSETLRNDIALIHIPALKDLESIAFVVLPPPTEIDPTYEGMNAIATGWGKTSDNSNLPRLLQAALLGVISNEECEETYGEIIYEGILCTETINGTSTCQGDSGGPLTLEGTNIQIGITSFGSSAGCTVGLPAGFTSTSYHNKWIESNSRT